MILEFLYWHLNWQSNPSILFGLPSASSYSVTSHRSSISEDIYLIAVKSSNTNGQIQDPRWFKNVSITRSRPRSINLHHMGQLLLWDNTYKGREDSKEEQETTQCQKLRKKKEFRQWQIWCGHFRKFLHSPSNLPFKNGVYDVFKLFLSGLPF